MHRNWSNIFNPNETKSGERPDVGEMIKFALEERAKNPEKLDFKVSVELEKTYEGVENLGTEADVVFVSKEFSAKFGCETGEEMVKKFRKRFSQDSNKLDLYLLNRLRKNITENSMLICPWGDKGAFAR